MTPTTAVQVAIWLVVLVPGIVYRTVRLRASGTAERDREPWHRALAAFISSAGFVAIYFVVAGERLIAAYRAQVLSPNLVGLGWTVLIACFVVPVVFGILVNIASNLASRQDWRNFRGWLTSGAVSTDQQPSKLKHRTARILAWFYSNGVGHIVRTTAWDRHVPRLGGTWVRIRKRDGVFLMGFLSSTQSFVSTYPDRPSLFLYPQASVDAKGRYVRNTESGRGLWYELEPGDYIEFLDPDKPEGAGPQRGSLEEGKGHGQG